MRDYKVTVNPLVDIDHYPLPTAEDIFAKLAEVDSLVNWICPMHVVNWS